MRNTRLIRLIAVAALLRGGVAAFAQSGGGFDLSWSTIDGGGGTSTGGLYSVSGTIGQPDAGTMSGGNYQLAGGFWGLIATIQTPGSPLLRIDPSGANVVISWPLPATGFVLDQSTTLNSPTTPWTPVAFPYQTNASRISITVPASIGNKFYRLRNP
jgi:hypothetical protein